MCGYAFQVFYKLFLFGWMDVLLLARQIISAYHIVKSILKAFFNLLIKHPFNDTVINSRNVLIFLIFAIYYKKSRHSQPKCLKFNICIHFSIHYSLKGNYFLFYHSVFPLTIWIKLKRKYTEKFVRLLISGCILKCKMLSFLQRFAN